MAGKNFERLPIRRVRSPSGGGYANNLGYGGCCSLQKRDTIGGTERVAVNDERKNLKDQRGAK